MVSYMDLIYSRRITVDARMDSLNAWFCPLQPRYSSMPKATHLSRVSNTPSRGSGPAAFNKVSSSRRSAAAGLRRRRFRIEIARAVRKTKPSRNCHSAKPATWPSTSKISLRMGGSTSGASLPPNKFVLDINVHLPDDVTGDSIKRILKRVLLDTGADLNLISSSAFRDVQTPMTRVPGTIHSLSGQTSIEGKTRLSLNFLNSDAAAKWQQQAYSEDFFVISPSETALFDCILGHRWVFNHLDEVLALMAVRR